MQVLQGLDFEKFQIKVILVERNKYSDLEIDKLLTFTGCNTSVTTSTAKGYKKILLEQQR